VEFTLKGDLVVMKDDGRTDRVGWVLKGNGWGGLCDGVG
jgi:hypothetical protein